MARAPSSGRIVHGAEDAAARPGGAGNPGRQALHLPVVGHAGARLLRRRRDPRLGRARHLPIPCARRNSSQRDFFWRGGKLRVADSSRRLAAAWPRAARHAQPRACSRNSSSRWSRLSSGLPSRRADWILVSSCAVRAQRRLISAAVPAAGGTLGALVPVGGVARIFTAPPLQLGGIGLSE